MNKEQKEFIKLAERGTEDLAGKNLIRRIFPEAFSTKEIESIKIEIFLTKWIENGTPYQPNIPIPINDIYRKLTSSEHYNLEHCLITLNKL